MLKKRLCVATFRWSLACDGPLLIADGRYQKEKKQEKDPDKVFISRASEAAVVARVKALRTGQGELELPFYVPGTSLRGPLRSQAELIVRSLAPGDAEAPRTACDPFEDGEENPASKSCSARMDQMRPEVPYEAACPACKLFGCTGTASRVQLADADLEPGYRSVMRDMIGIDRFTGGVYSGANMRFHALEGARFTAAVVVRNFELWQLGLLAYVFRDFASGEVAIGFGKSKGFGRVEGRVEEVTLTYPAGRAEGHVEHLGSLASAGERERYGLDGAAAPACALEPTAGGGWSLYESFRVADLEGFQAAAAAAFNRYLAERFNAEAA